MPNLSRREFLKGVVALGAGAVLYKYSDGSYRIAIASAGAVTYQLRIIHTNDHHAHIDPVTLTIGRTPDNKDAIRNFGGVSRRKTLFDQIRAEPLPANPLKQDRLFLDAGDVFQGTLYFNLYEGAADHYFYNRLGYHAVAVGNHEFDKGDQTLADFISGPAGEPSTFPVLSANITVGAGSPLAALRVTGDTTPNGKLGQRTIIDFSAVSGEKVGIFSLTPPDTFELSSPSPAITFDSNLVGVAQAQVDALKAAGATKIVALTHVGYLVDLDLASKVKGINVIVGGHSHTPLVPDAQATFPILPTGTTRVDVYPKLVNDPDGNQVVVVQDYEWGKWAGDIVVGFDGAGKVAEIVSGVIDPVWADGMLTAPPNSVARAKLANEGDEIPPDATFQNKINTDYAPGVDALRNQEIGDSAVVLDGARPNVRTRETNLGDLIADALRERIQREADFNPGKLPVVTITNGGGIRDSINVGKVTVGEVLTVLPFGNTLATAVLTGAQLLAALENGVSQVETTAGRFPQVAGLRFLWNIYGTAATSVIAGSRIVSADVYEPSSQLAGSADMLKPLDPARQYLVVTNNFMLTGGDGYTSIAAGTDKVDTGLIMADVVQEYITARSPVNQGTDGRILRLYGWMPLFLNQATFVD